MNMRLIGLPLPVVYSVQAAISALTLAAVVWIFWRLALCGLLTATFLVTSYAFNYHMVVFGWATLKLLQRSDNDAWDYALMLAVWALPCVTVPMGIGHLPGSFVPILGLMGRLLWRLRRTERTASGGGTTAAHALSAGANA
jgi:hypothetical protein